MHELINPKYSYLQDYLKSIPSNFRNPDFGTILHSGRNVIKVVEIDGIKLVVKNYCHISLFNRIIYGSIRKSKSHRAFYHAIRLSRLGIDSPEAIAAIDVRRNCRLVDSYFISLYSDYKSMTIINDYLHDTLALEPLMSAVAGFIIKLHSAGVLHRDLNISNILYSKAEDEEYKFQIVDTNRMSFKQKLTVRERVENLRRLSCVPATYCYILEQYTKQIRLQDHNFELKGILARLIFDERQRIKQRVKHKIKQICF